MDDRRRELDARFEAITRQWLAARQVYRRLHDAHVKDFVVLREAARRLDQLERRRQALRRERKRAGSGTIRARPPGPLPEPARRRHETSSSRQPGLERADH